MRSVIRVGALAATILGLVACATGPGTQGAQGSSLEWEGATFEIADAAIASNCLNLAFAVRGYSPPAGAERDHGVPPVKTVVVQTDFPGVDLDPQALGGGGGGGGNDEDGRVWMREERLFSLRAPVPEGTEVTLEITILLNDDFGRSEPLQYRVPVIAGPGGGSCPRAGPSQ